MKEAYGRKEINQPQEQGAAITYEMAGKKIETFTTTLSLWTFFSLVINKMHKRSVHKCHVIKCYIGRLP